MSKRAALLFLLAAVALVAGLGKSDGLTVEVGWLLAPIALVTAMVMLMGRQ